MLTISVRASLLIGWILLGSGSLASAQQEPPSVQQARSEAIQDCQELGGGRARFTPAYLRRVTVSPDGIDDFLLDQGGVDCPGVVSGFCGTGGCSMELHISTPGGYRRVQLGTTRGVQIEQAGGRTVVVLSVHGSACGRMGAAICLERRVWNGAELLPAGRPQLRGR